jgi:uncharacterized protein (TIGR00369 family)
MIFPLVVRDERLPHDFGAHAQLVRHRGRIDMLLADRIYGYLKRDMERLENAKGVRLGVRFHRSIISKILLTRSPASYYRESMDATIERDNLCFCCGADNERGLHLTVIYPEPGMAEANILIPTWFAGWKSMTHGGLLSTLLDEIMAHACVGTGRRAVTAELTVRFRKPVETGSRIRAVGKLEEARGKVLSTTGWLYDVEGSIVASATARFIAEGTNP